MRKNDTPNYVGSSVCMTRLTGLFLMQISIAGRFELVDTAELRCGTRHG